jgi:hypothetical protein
MIGPFDADDDQTPITHEEREGLIPTHVALRSELNELEQLNIARAAGATRRAYIEALQAADGHDLDPLVAFARS